MGYVLVNSLFRDRVDAVESKIYRLPPYPYYAPNFFSPKQVRKQRNALVVRNLHDAVVSGYLYHRDGRECWKDKDGRQLPVKKRVAGYHMSNVAWETRINNTAAPNHVPPAASNRSLCEYLMTESEEHGMRSYVEFAWKYWYQPYVVFWNHVLNFHHQQQQQQQEQQQQQQSTAAAAAAAKRVLLVCFEDLNDPVKQRSAFDQIVNWMYPTGYPGDVTKFPTPPAAAYNGTHSTGRDAQLKQRLRNLAVRYDKEILNGVMAAANAQFQCGGSGGSGGSSGSGSTDKEVTGKSTTSQAAAGVLPQQKAVLFQPTAADQQTNYTNQQRQRRIVSSTSINASSSAAAAAVANETACSCFNPAAVEPCCARQISTIHKMGYVLVNSVFKRHVDNIETNMYRLPPYPYYQPNFFGPKRTAKHRNALVVRNFYDAVVSGYLYHRAGRECWTNKDGKLRKNVTVYHMAKVNWEKHINTTAAPDHVPPPGKNRTLCDYLNSESEQDGMRVYIEFAWKYWYEPYVIFWNHVIKFHHQQQQQSTAVVPPAKRVLLVCFEDLDDPTKQRSTMERIVDWMYPTGYPGDVTRFKKPPAAAYNGTHSTSRDVHLKQRLRDLAVKYDSEILNGVVAAANDQFQCGVSSSTDKDSSGVGVVGNKNSQKGTTASS